MTDSIAAAASGKASPPLLTDTPYAWRRLGYGMLIGVICNAAHWTSVSLMPSLQAEFALTRAEASHPYIAIMLGFLVGSPFLGRMTDRFGITRVLICATVVVSLSYCAGGMAPNIYIFLISQFFVGLGSAVGFAPLAADISHWFRRRRGLALSLASCAGYFSGLFWTKIIAQTLQNGTWRDVHMVIGIGVLGVIPLSFLLRRRVPTHVLDAADIDSAKKAQDAGLSPRVVKWMLAVAGLGCCVAMAIPQIHIVAICGDFGFSLAQGNDVLSAMIMAGIASRIVVGLLIDKLGPIPILLIGSTLQMLALVLYIQMNGSASLYLVSIIFGFAQGGILPAYPLIVREYLPARSAGEVIGFISMWTLFGMAFGGWLSGWLYDQTGSYATAFLNGIGWNLLNILLISLLFLCILSGRKKRATQLVTP